ncbi:MAG: putative metal-binding motif-containing protein [Deltaproteobacteria bacterium]|nr:putative metal-binding motif-containing protein [Deltaproteobacteria bacterium]
MSILAFILACENDSKVSVYNAPPEVSITAPPSGTMANEGTTVDFEGKVQDRETDPSDLAITWSSTIDGMLSEDAVVEPDGSVAFSIATLSVGTHEITLAATDADGNRSEYSIDLGILEVPDAPEIEIVHPVAGEVGRDDEDFSFAAKVSDNQDEADLLSITITSEASGEVCTGYADKNGDFSCTARLGAGTHYLDFTVTDTAGLTATDQAALVVDSYLDHDDDGDGWNETQGDCDDANDAVSPAASETFNGVDDDCDDLVDEGTSGFDDDGDGFAEVDGDCDDTDATTYPGATEDYDAADNDCDGVTDEGTNWYDDDGDGYTEIAGDCDDNSVASYPGAGEIEDGRDNDCDSVVDEGTAAYDDDGDGYSENGGDCDDGDDESYPGAPEDYSDYVDQDCNGVAEEDFDGDGHLSMTTGGDDCDDGDEWAFPGAAENESDPALCFADADDDGWGDATPASGVEIGEDCDDTDDSISPDGTEECDSADNDCDGSTDEVDADGCTTYYYDYDGDGFGSESVSGRCLCSTSGYYTSSYDTDCYDFDANAAPGVTSYSTSDRGDGSYDWNCDGSEEKYFKTTGECAITSLCSVTEGWSGSVKSCGVSGSYITGCSFNLSTLSCTTSSGSKTQRCR